MISVQLGKLFSSLHHVFLSTHAFFFRSCIAGANTYSNDFTFPFLSFQGPRCRVNTHILLSSLATLTSIIKSLRWTISVSSNVIHLLTLHVTPNFPKVLTSMSLHLLH